jgi:hypothetical protein
MQTPRIIRNTVITALVIAAFVISYYVTEADFGRLLRNLPNGQELVMAFLTPDVATHRFHCISHPVRFCSRGKRDSFQRTTSRSQRELRRPAHQVYAGGL